MKDCGTDSLPYPTEKNGKKKKILIPELTSITKYLFDPNLGNQRLALYSFLNKQLRMGWLSRTVGFDVRNRVINSEVCSFTDVTFRKINRENFYADVNVKLILQTDNGTRKWDGILECWCSFEGEFTCSVESLTDKRKRRESGYELLNPFLVPYCTNQRMDIIAEEIWVKYGMPEARNAYELARRMGLDIQYLPVYDHNGIPNARGAVKWSISTILSILQNEKYAGDALLQKTFTVDCISKKTKKNTGELPMYLCERPP